MKIAWRPHNPIGVLVRPNGLLVSFRVRTKCDNSWVEAETSRIWVNHTLYCEACEWLEL